MNALIPRNTVEQIVAYRDAAVSAYHGAFASTSPRPTGKLKRGRGALEGGGRRTCLLPLTATATSAKRSGHFFEAVEAPRQADQWISAPRSASSTYPAGTIWCKMTDLDVAHGQARPRTSCATASKWVPGALAIPGRGDEQANWSTSTSCMGIPPVTVDNVYATIDKWAGEAEMIFRRGIADGLLHQLDRRFRSHDGFKVGEACDPHQRLRPRP
jgi:hypothetical protein